jgi:hypothetical protein
MIEGCMNRFACGVLLCAALSCTAATFAQNTPQSDTFSRKNTFTLFAEYSNDSSTILVAQARQRKLAAAGGAYTRRVVRFLGSDLSYQIELRPVLFESDPLERETQTVTVTTGPTAGTVTTITGSYVPIKCVAGTTSGTIPADPPYFPGESYVITEACGRQWTFGQSFAPIGFKYALRTHHSVQPFLIGTLGYMYTSRPVPLTDAEAFNFVINLGAGVELYRSHTRSLAIEARVQHFSNRDTAEENPGTENLIFKVSYSFGR